MRLTLDSNILVYAADRDAGSRHLIAQRIVRRAADLDCLLTLQALAEFFRVATGKCNVPPKEAATIVANWRDVFPVHAADAETLTAAMDAVAGHSLAFWDAMIWAIARQAGCRLLLSEDLQHGRELGGVVFINPFVEPAAALLSEALGSW
ncbi:MAG TPA: PIN domain-containing protein [Candidatus Sulfotelmatobacter sp.]|nr:PIN domain-containing protein [Candidatus Sulfotelmatobacter sp.]